ncbi:hypothetical protein V492_06646 [Pseudogymnoascus sp. VKM F-4246]|nr:hypothetical protein V492_06646 [Pseudogymnoascus sp. VKM F-4246]
MTAPARTRRAAILPWQARLLYEIGLSHLDTLKAHNSQNALPLIPQLRCLGDGTRSPRRRRCCRLGGENKIGKVSAGADFLGPPCERHAAAVPGAAVRAGVDEQSMASEDPSSSSWNWNVDARQRQALANAISRGANHLELFSNSPMWWMTKNKNPSGASDGSENIQSWSLGQHAIYMANVARHFKTNFNIAFTTVDPFNEPSASCRGLTSLKIVASDESYFDQAATNLQQTGSTALSKISKVNVHGYQGTSGRRDLVASLAQAAGKPVWNSEFGDSDGTSIGMVTNMFLDFQYLLPTGWVYWQAVDGGGWGLLDGNNDNGQINGVNVKFYVLSQFTRHIREGMRIVDAGNANAIAAYDSSAEKLFIVAANLGSA